MAVKKSQFVVLLLLYGLVMVLLGFTFGVSLDRQGPSPAGLAGESTGADGTPASDAPAAETTEDAQGGDDDEDDQPVPQANLLLGTGPVDLPHALLAGQFADATAAQAMQQRLASAEYEDRILEIANTMSRGQEQHGAFA